MDQDMDSIPESNCDSVTVDSEMTDFSEGGKPANSKFGGMKKKVGGIERRGTRPPMNSTSTLFVSSTITVPNTDKIILAMSTILQYQLTREAPASDDEAMRERVDFFNENRYSRRARVGEVILPEVEDIFRFIKSAFDLAQFSPECNVIALVYCNRLMAVTGMPLHAQNWRPIVLSAILLAQKVWDDRCLANVDFPYIWQNAVPQADASLLTLKAVNAFERRFLELLQYNVTVSSSVYAKYYFDLRSLCKDSANGFKLPPLSRDQAARIEAINSQTLVGGLGAAQGSALGPGQTPVQQNRSSGRRDYSKSGGGGSTGAGFKGAAGAAHDTSLPANIAAAKQSVDWEEATYATPLSHSRAVIN